MNTNENMTKSEIKIELTVLINEYANAMVEASSQASFATTPERIRLNNASHNLADFMDKWL